MGQSTGVVYYMDQCFFLVSTPHFVLGGPGWSLWARSVCCSCVRHLTSTVLISLHPGRGYFLILAIYSMWGIKSETEYRFNHLGLKLGKVLYSIWNWVLQLGMFFSRHNFFPCYSGLKYGGKNYSGQI